jgi:prevent-host-death family protein
LKSFLFRILWLDAGTVRRFLSTEGSRFPAERSAGRYRLHEPLELAGSERNAYNLVTMAKHLKTIPAGEFKARCLALLDEVAETGKPLLVTKRGKPVARLVPVEAPPGLLHSVKKEKDLVSPIGEDWDAAS